MGSSADHPQVIAPPPLIFALELAAGGLLQWLYPWPLAPWRLTWEGVGLIALGILNSLWAVLIMRRAGTNLNPERPATALVQSGPFAFSRNPIYLSMALSSGGVALWANSVWLVLSLAATIAVITYGVIIPEERYLTEKFGQTYVSYRARVRRWL